MSPAQNTKHSRSAKAAATRSARAPRRCHKCPNLPLKATCSCSKRRGVVQNSDPTIGFSDLNLSSVPSLNLASTTQEPGLHVIAGPVPTALNVSEPDGRATSGSEIGAADLHEGGDSSGSVHGFPEIPHEQLRPGDTCDLLSPSIVASNHQMVIDPALLVEEQSQALDRVTDHDVAGIDNEDRRFDEDPNGVGKVRGTRLTAAEKATKHGVVDGVMRGNMVYRIVRQNEKRRLISDASAATTRYNRELPLILSRVERMALETDTYVLVLAQQATGSSASVHFASERLRREAFHHTTGLVNEFQSLMTQLVIAKRSTTLALAQSLEASEKARAEVEGKLAEREDVAARTEAELAASRRANEALLSELEALRTRALNFSAESNI